MDISKANMFVSANSSPDGYFQGKYVLHEYGDKCGVVRPDALRSTKLRKQFVELSVDQLHQTRML